LEILKQNSVTSLLVRWMMLEENSTLQLTSERWDNLGCVESRSSCVWTNCLSDSHHSIICIHVSHTNRQSSAVW